MLNFLRNKNIIKSNHVCGIYCYISPGGEPLFYYVLISRDKGKIRIDKTGTIQGSIGQLSGQVPDGVPVYLSVDGKGVLTKKIMVDPLQSPIHQVIPNALEDEFVFQQSNGVENLAFVSIARKEFVDRLLADFSAEKFQVLGLVVGPFKVVRLLHLFDHLPDELSVGNYLIHYHKELGGIVDFKKREEDTVLTESYLIDGQYLSAGYLLPFNHALSYYVPDEDELQYPAITEQYEEYTAKRIFIVAGWGALLLIFVVLLGNMFMFTQYSDEKKGLESQAAGNKELLETLKTLKDELAWKEKFLSQAGILKNTRMSYYADQVARTLPHDITLENMEIHPIVSRIKNKKEIELQPDKINIDGIAENSQLVNNWINELKKLNWIEDVAVVDYSKEDNVTTGSFSIEIEINRSMK